MQCCRAREPAKLLRMKPFRQSPPKKHCKTLQNVSKPYSSGRATDGDRLAVRDKGRLEFAPLPSDDARLLQFQRAAIGVERRRHAQRQRQLVVRVADGEAVQNRNLQAAEKVIEHFAERVA